MIKFGKFVMKYKLITSLRKHNLKNLEKFIAQVDTSMNAQKLFYIYSEYKKLRILSILHLAHEWWCEIN
jgi:hypothetical protein